MYTKDWYCACSGLQNIRRTLYWVCSIKRTGTGSVVDFKF